MSCSPRRHAPRLNALIPENDEMVLNNAGQTDANKTNLYRMEVGQAPVNGSNNQVSSPAMYCQNMVNIQTPFLAANQAVLSTGQAPVTAVGDNLFTFLANRLSMSFTNLACQNFGLTNPVTVTLNAAGAAVAATFNTTQQTVAGTSASMPYRWHHRGRNHHQKMDPSGM